VVTEHVSKGTSVEELLRVIYDVQRGDSYLPPDTILASLTSREREVLFHWPTGGAAGTWPSGCMYLPTPFAPTSRI
jgi:hypothetical protein